MFVLFLSQEVRLHFPIHLTVLKLTTFALNEGDRAAGALGLRLWEGTCQVWDLL